MNTHHAQERESRLLKRTKGLVLAGLMGCALWQTGCEAAVNKDFREAALPAIENGVGLILDGVVDGVFAAIDVDNPTSTN